jgi:tetratricopeptide (TPR) repeat protein
MKYSSIVFLLSSLLVLCYSVTAMAVSPFYDFYLKSGWKARQDKNYVLAEDSYLNAARFNPQSSDARVGLLYTYIDSSDFLKAEVIADQSLKADPDNLWVRKGAAWIFYKQGRYDDAIAQYSYVLKEAGEDHTMKLGLGLSLYFAGRKKEAREICLECRGYLDENDERLRLCLGENLGEKGPSWRVSPSVFASYTDHSDSMIKEYSATVTTGLEVFHRSGLGLYLQVAGLMFSQIATNERYQQYSTHSALFYSTPATSLWGNRTRLNGDYEGEEPADIYSLYGSQRIGFLHLGAEGSKGSYMEFKTLQYQPELGFYWWDHYLMKLSFMVQESSGEKTLSLTEMKTRYSTALDFKATYDLFSFSLSAYYGERWFTVEDQGLNIWNADEELEWGGKLNLDFHHNKNRSYFISLRVDKANKQFGLENDFYTTGITTGIKVNF